METVKLKLRKPIKAHAEEVAELTFREPTAKDIRQSGMPYAIETSGAGARRLVVDANACALLIGACCGIPPSSVDMLSALDFADAQGLVMDFFGATTPGSSSAAPGSSPGSMATSTAPSA